MSKLLWDKIGERIAEAGVQQGVLFPMLAGVYQTGVAWNGLTSVSEAPTGGEPSPFYADNRKYIEIMSEEEFAGTIGCYTYPDEFKSCIGEKELAVGVTASGQVHAPFGFAYRTEMLNDTDGSAYGYKIHLVYNALAGVAEREHTTINESPELDELSYDFTTTKVDVTGAKPTAHLVIDSTKILPADAAKLTLFLETVFGRDESVEPVITALEPKLPTPDEVAAIFAAA